MPSKLSDVTGHIIQGIKDQCNQIQVKDDNIINNERAFECPTYPEKTVVYNAHLHGNELTNTSILVSCLDKWIQNTRDIVVNEVDLEINKECTSVINNVNSSLDCGSGPNPTKESNISHGKGLAIGLGTLSAILVVIMVIFCIGIVW
jgi:hypothetical protein